MIVELFEPVRLRLTLAVLLLCASLVVVPAARTVGRTASKPGISSGPTCLFM